MLYAHIMHVLGTEERNMLNEMSSTAFKSICWIFKFDAFLVNMSETFRKK